MTQQDLFTPPNAEAWREQGWPSIVEEEQKKEKELEQKKRIIEAGIRMASSLFAMMTSPAYKDFTASVKEMQAMRMGELLATRNEHEMVTLKGRCLELQAILSMVHNVKFNMDHLANELEKVEDDLSALKAPQPQLQPTEATA